MTNSQVVKKSADSLGAPKALIESSKQRTVDFIQKIRKAMQTIEGEIDTNNGIYPYNGGRLSQAELCRRAEVTNVGLATPAHRDTTRKMVGDWLARINSASITGRKSVRRAVTDRADDWKRQHDAIAQSYRIAELEHLEFKRKYKKLEEENAALRKLLESASTSKVVTLRKRPKDG
ncbi:MAG: hypothetical protein ACO1PM_20810 [Acidovorax sp.]